MQGIERLERYRFISILSKKSISVFFRICKKRYFCISEWLHECKILNRASLNLHRANLHLNFPPKTDQPPAENLHMNYNFWSQRLMNNSPKSRNRCMFREPTHSLIWRNLIIPILLIFSLSSNLYAQRYPDTTVENIINKGISCILNQDYQSAEKDFEELKDKYPALPLGEIYLAGNKIAESIDFGYEFDGEIINNNLDKAIDKAETLFEKDEENIWNIYFVALSKGYYAYYKALSKNWFSAISNGFDAIKYFEKCLQKDSSFYDAYIAIGNFKYWKSRKSEFLNWLLFVSDESEDGINYLKKAVNNPGSNNYLAIYSLQWIYIDQRKYAEVIKLSKPVLKKYPENRFFKWALARAYEETDKKQAVKIYYEILNSYSEIDKLSKFHEILLKHLIAQQYEQLGELNKAMQLCNEILTVNYSSSWHKGDLEKRIGRVEELKEKIILEMGRK